MKKIMLFYPPGRFYQRGEDRSQGNVEQSTATSMRAPNDLGYAASTLAAKGFDVFLRDYQTERKTREDLFADFRAYGPDALFVSVTNATIFGDLRLVKQLKRLSPRLMVMLKGAIFFKPEKEMLDELDLTDVDYLLGLESEFTVASLTHAHFNGKAAIPGIRGILYKKDGVFVPTDFDSWETDLDGLPFPDRSRILNALYNRPDTGEAQATIATSRGCPSRCIFCMTPAISGTRLRLRSPENILAELRECYHKHGIRNFFFKSDTFTFDQKWTKAVCEAILASDLAGKIEWVANSRVKPLKPETLHLMKQAGCWLVAFGYESGHPDTLARMKKGTTVEDNIQAAQWAKEAGLLTFGFFLIGLPWEGPEHLAATKKHIFDLDPDFLELHIAIPYYGTRLHEIAQEEGLISDTVLGRDYFNAPTVGSKSLSMAEIEAFRRKTLLRFHLRPSYILRKLKQAGGSPRILKNYFRYGLRLLKNNIAALGGRKRAGGLPHEPGKPPRILILGANSDIAKALAELLARRENCDLILASRDQKALAETAQSLSEKYGVCVTAVPFDATDDASHKAFYDNLPEKPDGAVLAFGLLDDQKACQEDFSRVRKVLDVNFTGAASILEILAADFEARKRGFILGITSPAGERGRKSNYVYGAAKAALTAYLSGLRHRLAASNVSVVALTPGFARTKMTAGMKLPKLLTASPEKAAEAGLAAIRNNKANVYAPGYWRPIMAIVRNLPDRIFNKTNL